MSHIAGKQVVRRLLRAGIPTTVLDIIFFDRELADIRAQYPHGDLEFVKGDIRSSDDLERSMKGVKGVEDKDE
jgi:nucleoside-diphosphate-sugar epimerase